MSDAQPYQYAYCLTQEQHRSRVLTDGIVARQLTYLICRQSCFTCVLLQFITGTDIATLGVLSAVA